MWRGIGSGGTIRRRSRAARCGGKRATASHSRGVIPPEGKGKTNIHQIIAINATSQISLMSKLIQAFTPAIF
jgi:hypothetical protein